MAELTRQPSPLTYSQLQLTDFLNSVDKTGIATEFFQTATIVSEQYIKPLERQMWSDQNFNRDLFPLMGKQGLLGIMLPSEYGGTELGHFPWIAVISAIAYESGSTALNVVANSDLCAGQIARFANKQQKDEYLPGLIAGEKIGALAMTEPNAGSDVLGSMKTNAKKVDGGWVLNGEKTFITNAGIADVYFVYARTGPTEATAFLVDKDTPGFSVGAKMDKITMRASPTHPVYLDDCYVDDSHVVGAVGEGRHILMAGLPHERLALAAIGDGLSRGAIDEVRGYALERKQFEKHLYDFQGVSFPISQMRNIYDTFRDNLFMTSWRADQDPAFFEEDNKLSANDKTSSVFYNASRTTIAITQEGLRMLGGVGLTHEYCMGRRHNDAQLLHTGGGTENIRLIQTGRAIFTP